MGWWSASRRYSRASSPKRSFRSLAEKIRVVLYVIFFALVLIALRAWHLTVVERDAKEEEARRPQKRVVVESAKRGTIRDRFNIPLAVNKIQYQASIVYSQIQQVPSFRWVQTPKGRVKKHVRKEYITRLSDLLAKELNLEADRLEDLIHSKAALYNQMPFVIKDNLSEKEYYRLRMLEKDWLGLSVRCIPCRYYPQGKTGADIVGYMGAINRKEYEQILHEMQELEEFIAQRDIGEDPPLPVNIQEPQDAYKRLQDLQEKAYTLNDFVGKTGIEHQYEEALRGFKGQKSYYSDARGNFLRELPGSREPLPGQRILLSISTELQAYAEELLIANEEIRQARYTVSGSTDKSTLSPKQPWIKGGAILALDPHTGELLAMASHPRYDPNDFVQQNSHKVARWFENESYLADIWDERIPLERELYDYKKREITIQSKKMNWDTYLDFVLPLEGSLRQAMESITRIENAVELQEAMQQILDAVQESNAYAVLNEIYKNDADYQPYGQALPLIQAEEMRHRLAIHADLVKANKFVLDHYLGALPRAYDKVLIIDLCRLAIDSNLMDDDVLEVAGKLTLSEHKQASGAASSLQAYLKKRSKILFHHNDFALWRSKNEQNFLKEKRQEEKNAKKYQKPYIDYLDAEENRQFNTFWNAHSQELLAALMIGEWGAIENEELLSYLYTFQDMHTALEKQDETAILSAKEEGWYDDYLLLSKAIQKLPSVYAFSYLGALRPYKALTRPLLGKYRSIRQDKGQQLEKHLATAFYPVHGFGYGRSNAYRQATTQGSIFKTVTAYTAMLQQFMEGKPLNPLTITDVVQKNGNQVIVAYKEDGTPVPQHYNGGRIPKSLTKQIGKIDVIKAISYSSNPYFSLLAGEVLASPEVLAAAARIFSYGSPTGLDLPGEISGRIPEDLHDNKTGLYAMAIGQHTLVVTPIQAATMLATIANGGKVMQPKVVSLVAGRQPKRTSEFGPAPRFTFQETLNLVGIDFPLFSAVAQRDNLNVINPIPPTVRREIPMPSGIREMILEGMRQVVTRTLHVSLRSLKRYYKNMPEALIAYENIGTQLIGKTSTSEAVEALDLELPAQSRIYNHLWFGGILFDQKEEKEWKEGEEHTFAFKDEFGNPELVVVVYLKFGGYGKEAAPLAAMMASKWRQIKTRAAQ